MTSANVVRDHIAAAIEAKAQALRQINQDIHSHPELAYEEGFAHDALSSFLEAEVWRVKPDFGSADNTDYMIVFCAEYDALPGIGHGCGHNLITTASLAASLGLAEAIRQLEIPARGRILGTPAEEGRGGKAKLIEAGAFTDPAILAAIMSHPIPQHCLLDGYQGIAGFPTIASHKLRVEYRGRGAHAAGDPWNGLNAIHGVIEDGGTVANVIPDYSRKNWYIRSPTIERADKLLARAKDCFQASALATGCEINYIHAPTYMNMELSETFCDIYTREMGSLGRKVLEQQETPATISTDMGNLSHVVPSFHGVFGIQTPPGIPGHSAEFAKCAAVDEAHAEAILSASAMAMLGWNILESKTVKVLSNDV
ncbi:hypothetical protein BO71DRAFT_415063 [Aspergillus ellipticus CBS 707.79]|uniref:Peptidase M20 domain-containing protein 2 n=1 Tax=Aspergillus ellipticus CBS 707.79 TaxID=1448320 RepID=A0A319DV68_9EURO|nr:hypothetical protein BO71DRAFT_415063 [Aspergillus ellipticus CBS 707.79]